MTVKIEHSEPIRVAAMLHKGSYETLSATFDELFEWVESKRVPIMRTIGIYWDNPEFVDEAKLRSAACVEIPTNYQFIDNGGLPIDIMQIVGGNYAMTRFVGPYEKLEPVWVEFTAYVENTLGRKITQDPAFEVYVNDPAETPASELITELFMPVV